MAKNRTSKGLMLIGSLRTSGITVYMKQGKMITRSSTSRKSGSNTLPQFIQRQKQRHAVALWSQLKNCDVMFTQHSTPYCNFLSLANRLPAVYVMNGDTKKASFVMPGIPVSDGTLPTATQWLGEVDGVPALLTDFPEKQWVGDEKFLLYTAIQDTHIYPTARFSMREVSREEMTVVNDCYALVNEEFADEMKGFALVHVIGERCSQQPLITRCTLYQQYTTDEAFQEAAESYGGLTERTKK